MNNKKTLFIVSGVIATALFVLNWIGTFRLCGGQEYGQCMDYSYSAIIDLLPIIPLFLFSLITYKMRDEVYQAWLRFSLVWIPLSMILIFFAPEYAANWLYPVTKGSVAFISSLFFTIISLVLITYKLITVRRGR